MPAPDRRAQMRDKLRKRQQESASRADDTGRFSNIFRTDVRVPLWTVSEGQHVLDILPYIVGNNYPSRTYPDMQPGDPTYLVDIWVHRSIGVNEDSFTCPSRNYDLPCPICEHIAELRRGIDPDADENDPEFGETVKLIKAIQPKRRVVYNILCWDTDKEIAKGVQVWEVAHFLMEKKLSAIAERPARGGTKIGGFINFADPWEGKSIVFRREGKGMSTEYLGHSFEDRPEPLADDFNALLEGNEEVTYCLDELIVVPSYEILYEAYYGKAFTGEQTVAERVATETPPTRPRTRPPAAAVPATTPTARGRAQSAPATQTEASTPPASRPRQRTATPPPEPEPEPENEGLPVCPAGGTFGQDVDQYEQCSSCEVWDDCSQANVNLSEMAENEAEHDEAEAEPEPPPPPTRRPAPVSRQTAAAPAPRARSAAPPPAPRARSAAPPPAPASPAPRQRQAAPAPQRGAAPSARPRRT